MNNSQERELTTGLAAPALRALANAGITRLEQLTEISEAEIKQLHGMGPNGINQLRLTLAAHELSFAEKKSKPD